MLPGSVVQVRVPANSGSPVKVLLGSGWLSSNDILPKPRTCYPPFENLFTGSYCPSSGVKRAPIEPGASQQTLEQHGPNRPL